MLRIGVRELRQNASRYLARVKAGETVEVTERGVLVARLMPPCPAGDGERTADRGGRLIPAKGPRHLPSAEGSTGRATRAVLDDLREDRL